MVTARESPAVDHEAWPPDQRGMFAAEAWVLVHYLVASGQYENSSTRRLGEYLGSIDSGTQPEQAFEKAFEVDLGAFDRCIKRYLEQAGYLLARAGSPPTLRVSDSPVTLPPRARSPRRCCSHR